MPTTPKFKKKAYRSWDIDLLESIKLTETDSHEKTIKSLKAEGNSIVADPHRKLGRGSDIVQNEPDKGSDRVKSEQDQGSVRVQNEPDQGSVRVQNEPDQGSVRVQNEPVQGSIRVQNKSELDSMVSLPVLDIATFISTEDIENLIHKLGINEKIVFDFVLNLCINNNSLDTGLIRADELDMQLKMPRNSRETSIKRLCKKNLLFRKKGKTGKGGLVCIGMNKNIKKISLKSLSDQFVPLISSNRNSNELGFNSSSSSSRNISTTTQSWKKIDLSLINSTLNKLPGSGFGKLQLARIFEGFEKEGTIPNLSEIQKTINHFAFGLEHHSNEERYASIKKPVGLLCSLLKAGDTWEEPRYLTVEEKSWHATYQNLVTNTEKDFKPHFQRWISHDKSAKYSLYEQRIGSTQYYDERIFREMAYDDFEKNIWPEEKRQHVLQIMGNDKAELIARFEKIEGINKENS